MEVAEVVTVEAGMAAELLEQLDRDAAAELVAEDEKTIRFRLRGRGWKLSTVIFTKDGLRRLFSDPDRKTKIEYLQRDIRQAAFRRAEYRYPRRLVFTGA